MVAITQDMLEKQIKENAERRSTTMSSIAEAEKAIASWKEHVVQLDAISAFAAHLLNELARVEVDPNAGKVEFSDGELVVRQAAPAGAAEDAALFAADLTAKAKVEGEPGDHGGIEHFG